MDAGWAPGRTDCSCSLEHEPCGTRASASWAGRLGRRMRVLRPAVAQPVGLGDFVTPPLPRVTDADYGSCGVPPPPPPGRAGRHPTYEDGETEGTVGHARQGGTVGTVGNEERARSRGGTSGASAGLQEPADHAQTRRRTAGDLPAERQSAPRSSRPPGPLRPATPPRRSGTLTTDDLLFIASEAEQSPLPATSPQP